MTARKSVSRRQFNTALATTGIAAGLAPFGIVRAQSPKLKVGVLLPRSGTQALIGQSCQKGADLAAEVIQRFIVILALTLDPNLAQRAPLFELAHDRAGAPLADPERGFHVGEVPGNRAEVEVGKHLAGHAAQPERLAE